MTFMHRAMPLAVVSGIFLLVVAGLALFDFRDISLLGIVDTLIGLAYWVLLIVGLVFTCDAAASSLGRERKPNERWFSALVALIFAFAVAAVYYSGFTTHAAWVWWPVKSDGGALAVGCVGAFVSFLCVGLMTLGLKE